MKHLVIQLSPDCFSFANQSVMQQEITVVCIYVRDLIARFHNEDEAFEVIHCRLEVVIWLKT